MGIKYEDKHVVILITNKCNLKCGGCHQLCQWPRRYEWSLTLDELKTSIDLVIKHRRFQWGTDLALMGGEVLLHPQWMEIQDMLGIEYSNQSFVFLTNRSNYETKYKNIKVKHSIQTSKEHFAFMVASLDVLGNPDRSYYWKMAQEHCRYWRGCGSAIYRGKGYFCEHASAIDFVLTHNNLGWAERPITPSQNEIDEQASNFCYRCGYLLEGLGYKINQPVIGSTLISITNLDIVKTLNVDKNSYNLIEF